MKNGKEMENSLNLIENIMKEGIQTRSYQRIYKYCFKRKLKPT